MKKKGNIIGLILVTLMAISTKPVYAYYEQRQEEKRLAQKPFFTEYGLSYQEFSAMVTKYWVKEGPYSWWDSLDEEAWPDYSYYTMEATEDTEMAVAVLNYRLFDEFMESDVEGLERAQEYGFSSENRITVDWVMTHPKEAIYILHGMWEQGYIFRDYQEIKRIYDEDVQGSR